MLYFILLFIRIAAAIIWIGSIFTTSVLNISMARKQDLAGIVSLSKQDEMLGKFVIGPSAFITLGAGIALTEFFGFGWPFWVIWGFTVIILTGIIGGNFAQKTGEKLADIASSDKVDYDRLKKLQQRLTFLSSVTLLLLFSAVWVMIYKPTF